MCVITNKFDEVIIKLKVIINLAKLKRLHIDQAFTFNWSNTTSNTFKFKFIYIVIFQVDMMFNRVQ